MKVKTFFFTVVALLVFASTTGFASGAWKVEHKNAIVLAMFGTSVESALKGLAMVIIGIMIGTKGTLKPRYGLLLLQTLFAGNGGAAPKTRYISRPIRKFLPIFSM